MYLATSRTPRIILVKDFDDWSEICSNSDVTRSLSPTGLMVRGRRCGAVISDLNCQLRYQKFI